MNGYLDVSNAKNRDNHYGKEDVLSVSGDYGIVNQIEFQGRSFAGASVANFHHQLKGAILDAVDEGLIERDPIDKKERITCVDGG